MRELGETVQDLRAEIEFIDSSLAQQQAASAAAQMASVDSGTGVGPSTPHLPKSQSKPRFARYISGICHFIYFVSAYYTRFTKLCELRAGRVIPMFRCRRPA